MAYSRRNAREEALQVLYQLDMVQEITPESALFYYESHFSKDKNALDDFTRRLILGVSENLTEIDTKIRGASENWKLERMPAVDRNLLRIGAFEFFYCDDIPSTVTINELVEVAKLFGSGDSSGFVNGVLDKLKMSINRPQKAP